MAVMKARKYDLTIGELIIESAQLEDAEEIISFIKEVEGETNFLMRETNEFNMDIESEKKFIENKLVDEAEIFLVARVNGKIIGTLGFSRIPYNRYTHKGQFGISIMKAFWNYGIGYKSIDTLMKWSEEIGIVKINLEVDSNNLRAISLYRKFGFIEEGLLKYDKYLGNGVYVDSIIMGRVNNNILNIQI